MPIKINKVYTRTGDKGLTAGKGQKRVKKDSIYIEACGAIDEAQTSIGLLAAELSRATNNKEFSLRLLNILQKVQSDLFDIGHIISALGKYKKNAKRTSLEGRVSHLEKLMDSWTGGLPELNSFVISGGGTYSALAHNARAVCRRAERALWRLHRKDPVGDDVLAYANRLSDFLFVLARKSAKEFGEKETLW